MSDLQEAVKSTLQTRAGEGVLSLREGQISVTAKRPRENSEERVDDITGEGVNPRDGSSETG